MIPMQALTPPNLLPAEAIWLSPEQLPNHPHPSNWTRTLMQSLGGILVRPFLRFQSHSMRNCRDGNILCLKFFSRCVMTDRVCHPKQLSSSQILISSGSPISHSPTFPSRVPQWYRQNLLSLPAAPMFQPIRSGDLCGWQYQQGWLPC